VVKQESGHLQLTGEQAALTIAIGVLQMANHESEWARTLRSPYKEVSGYARIHEKCGVKQRAFVRGECILRAVVPEDMDLPPEDYADFGNMVIEYNFGRIFYV
jgi:hypothetical protein